MRRLLLATACMLAATPTYSAPWVIDKSASRLTFSGKQAGTDFTGTISDFTPVVEFEPAHPETGHIHVTIHMASAHIADDQEQNDALPTEDWFFTQQFPEAVFDSKNIHATGPHDFMADGTLTLRGITQPVQLPFTLKSEGKTTRAEGKTTLMRNVFNLGGSQWKDDKWIAYPVTVQFTLLANQP